MTGIFYPGGHATELQGYKIFNKKALQGEKINTVSKIVNFCKNNYNSAENTKFWARSNFNSFANVGPSMKNDGALEL